MEQERQLADLRNVRQVVTASTAAESKLAAIEEHLNCNVCFETVERPFAVNPCGHEFCAKCLKEWFKDKKSKNEAMECPMCRTLVEGRPVRAFLLRAVVDVINGNGAVTTNSSADDKEFWRELFPNTVAPTPALALAQPLPDRDGEQPTDVDSPSGVELFLSR
ncbi:hypothetical protein DL93DRAFT_96876 [Clavulina sp. PMI_390]|nr:hypothetical protein DL93DRAFT_96876 [Clavulina sp. PMI_390]